MGVTFLVKYPIRCHPHLSSPLQKALFQGNTWLCAFSIGGMLYQRYQLSMFRALLYHECHQKIVILNLPKNMIWIFMQRILHLDSGRERSNRSDQSAEEYSVCGLVPNRIQGLSSWVRFVVCLFVCCNDCSCVFSLWTGA